MSNDTTHAPMLRRAAGPRRSIGWSRRSASRADEGHTVAHRDNQIEFLTRMIRFLSDELHLPHRAP